MLQFAKRLYNQKSIKQIGIYTFSSFITKAISFAALPLFVNLLSEGDIGIMNIFSSTIVFLTPIVCMGSLYSISVEYFKLSKKNFANLFSTIFLIPLILSLLTFPVLYAFFPWLSKTFQYQNAFIWLIPICLLFNFCFEALMILVRNQSKPLLYLIVSLSRAIIEIGLALFLVLFVFKNWFGRAMGYFVGLCASSIFFIFFVRKEGFLIRKFEFGIIKKELLFGISGLFLQIGIFSVTSTDKFFVMAFYGKEQAGLYAIGATFAAIQYIVSASIMQYLQPELFKRFVAKEKWGSLKVIYKKYTLIMVFTAIALLVFTQGVYTLFLKSTYKEHIHYFYILSISTFIWSINNIFLQAIIFSKNKKVIVSVAIIAIFCALSINFTSTHFFNINWLCLGQIGTNFIVFLFIIFFNWRLKIFRK